MQIYHCKNCGFTFSRVGKVETCPDCGKPDIRPALEHEIQEFRENQEKWRKSIKKPGFHSSVECPWFFISPVWFVSKML